MSPTNGHTEQIPVLDISGQLPETDIAKAIVEAAATYGFVYVKSLGEDIPIEVIDHTFDLSRKFFSSPIVEKEKFKISDDNRGWVGIHTECLDEKNQRVGDFKEAMNLGEFVNGKAQQPLPPSLTDHEAELNDFGVYCKNLMLKILKLFAIGLQISPEHGGSTWFSSRHIGGPGGCTLRLLHYPPIPSTVDFQPEVDIRAGAHSDYGSITLLFQRPGQPGLEIIPPSTLSLNGKKNYSNTAAWTPVPVFPPGTESDPSPPILVNIGDLLSHWTNGYFQSTVHRVVFPRSGPEGGEDRYSIAYFGHPVGSTLLEAVPSEVVSQLKGRNGVGPEENHVMTADEHLMSRLKATYKGLYRDDVAKE